MGSVNLMAVLQPHRVMTFRGCDAGVGRAEYSGKLLLEGSHLGPCDIQPDRTASRNILRRNTGIRNIGWPLKMLQDSQAPNTGADWAPRGPRINGFNLFNNIQIKCLII
jgi:hypothetical protein